MMLKLLRLAPIILLAACAEKPIDELTYTERKELAGKLVQNCKDQGVSNDSPEMETCFKIEVDREIERREKSAERAETIGMAISAGANGYSSGYNRAAASYAPSYSTYRRSVNCTSNAVGSYTYTNCY